MLKRMTAPVKQVKKKLSSLDSEKKLLRNNDENLVRNNGPQETVCEGIH